jgi:hypothetical protein
MQKVLIFVALLAALTGCDKYYISICQSKIDEEYLASFHVNTPDPRTKNPPLGDRLIIEWQMPEELMAKAPSLYLHVIYKDYTEEEFAYPMPYRLDYVTYDLLGEEYLAKKGILTYEAEIKTSSGEVFRTWKHQLWTKLIVLKDEPKPSIQEDADGWEIPDVESHSSDSSQDLSAE